MGDHVVATFFPAPHSFTTEDTVEISAHGSPVVLAAILDACVRHGARLAAPGEFTFRAYVHGRIELTQAEAVADLVEAVTPLQARTAFDQLEGSLATAICGLSETLLDLTARLEASLDFPDEGYHFIDPDEIRMAVARLRAEVRDLLARADEGRVIREGRRIVIAGPVNAGKSSLFNRLAGLDRAIVAATPGTTRDLLVEAVDLGGVPVTLVDTAGLREHRQRGRGRGGPARRTGDRGRGRQPARARWLAAVAPRTSRSAAANGAPAETPRREQGRPATSLDRRDAGVEDVCRTSARTGEGLDQLREPSAPPWAEGMPRPSCRESPMSGMRRCWRQVGAALDFVLNDLSDPSVRLPKEVIVQGLTNVRALLEEISGARTPEDVLAHIFARFCIGK